MKDLTVVVSQPLQAGARCRCVDELSVQVAVFLCAVCTAPRKLSIPNQSITRAHQKRPRIVHGIKPEGVPRPPIVPPFGVISGLLEGSWVVLVVDAVDFMRPHILEHVTLCKCWFRFQGHT